MTLSNDTYLISGGRAGSTRDSRAWLALFQTRMHRIGALWAAMRTREREMRELERFSDRELWDLGLSRSDVGAIAKGTYRRG